MKKAKSTRKQHLALALISSAGLIYSIAQAVDQSFDISGGVIFNPQRGLIYAVGSLYSAMLILGFCSIFSWWGFIEDSRKARHKPHRKRNSESDLTHLDEKQPPQD